MGQQIQQKTHTQLAGWWIFINPIISILTLNVNGLNISITIQRLSDLIKTLDPTTCCLQKPILNISATTVLKKIMRNMSPDNIQTKNRLELLLISDTR